jgi:hypothetical protein
LHFHQAGSIGEDNARNPQAGTLARQATLIWMPQPVPLIV